MGYVDQNLISGEKVAYRGGLHWIVLLGPASVAVIFVLFGLAMLYEGASTKQPRFGQYEAAIGAIAILIGAINLFAAVVRRRSVEFAVTNKRVIFKAGVLRRRTQEMFLDKIESVNVGEGLLGRALNYGTIAIHGTGGTLEPFQKISHALEFRRQVQEQISKNR